MIFISCILWKGVIFAYYINGQKVAMINLIDMLLLLSIDR